MATDGDDGKWLFGLFAVTFAVSLVLHQLWWNGFEVRSLHVPVILAALWVARRPTSVVRFVAMIALEVVAVARDMPDVGSHTLLVLTVGASLLVYVGWTAMRSRRLPEAGALFERIAPFLGVQLLVVYAAAAIAKMNTGFFDASISCAALMTQQVAWLHPSLLDASWLVMPAIWGTALVEVALPVLLAVPRTRSLGLVLGTAFHAVLALAGNVPFSALALAVYVVFLPTDTATRLRSLMARRPRLGRWASHASRVATSRAVPFVAVSGWLVGSVLFPPDPGTRPALVSDGTRLLVVAAAAVGIALFVGAGGGTAAVQRPRSLRLGHPIFAIGVVLVVANSLSPYLGLKTDSSFTMFSNLYTEKGFWNHLFIPEGVRIFAYQDHLVRITGSNDPGLASTTQDGTVFVRYDLERYLRSRPGITAAYVSSAGEGPTMGTTRTSGPSPRASLLDRIFRFQTVPPPTRGGCSR